MMNFMNLYTNVESESIETYILDNIIEKYFFKLESNLKKLNPSECSIEDLDELNQDFLKNTRITYSENYEDILYSLFDETSVIFQFIHIINEPTVKIKSTENFYNNVYFNKLFIFNKTKNTFIQTPEWIISNFITRFLDVFVKYVHKDQINIYKPYIQNLFSGLSRFYNFDLNPDSYRVLKNNLNGATVENALYNKYGQIENLVKIELSCKENHNYKNIKDLSHISSLDVTLMMPFTNNYTINGLFESKSLTDLFIRMIPYETFIKETKNLE